MNPLFNLASFGLGQDCPEFGFVASFDSAHIWTADAPPLHQERRIYPAEWHSFHRLPTKVGVPVTDAPRRLSSHYSRDLLVIQVWALSTTLQMPSVCGPLFSFLDLSRTF